MLIPDIESNLQHLIRSAEVTRANAYSPYSKFAVGAALEGESGHVFVGCNVENRSLGLTTCAEQGALAAAVAAGERKFRRLAVVTGANVPTIPCGRCRQLLAEFSPELEIHTATATGEAASYNLRELLPLPTQGILDES